MTKIEMMLAALKHYKRTVDLPDGDQEKLDDVIADTQAVIDWNSRNSGRLT